MIDVQTKSLETLLGEAVAQAKADNGAQLLSVTEQIKDTDPVHFFASAGNLSTDRVFWTSTSESFSMAGVGNAWEIEAEKNRTQTAERYWQYLQNHALVHNPYQEPGTGLVALGGMSFDPDARSSGRWNRFGHGSLQVPNVLLTQRHARHYLTFNIQVRATDNVDDLKKWVQETKAVVTSTRQPLPAIPGIDSQEEIEPEQWKDTVQRAADTIKVGHAEKIVLARELRVTLKDRAPIASILNKLLTTQPNSYVFAIERDGDCFVGASPERLVKQDDEQLFSVCLAGTAPRGQTDEDDRAIAQALLHDDKNRSEHDFVVKMIRQAMDTCCDVVHVPDKPVIHPFQNLQHLYTPVTAKLNQTYSIFDIIDQLHPTPALGGVPREASLAFIREHEQLDRGWYGAPVGWVDNHRNGEFAVGIRSGLIRDDSVSLFAGCGVVRDSDPEAEYDETRIKLQPILSVLEGSS
ncbi:isochorismate synthase MenF [Lentibacillus halophilus]|uniref:Isochorismate synthase MenF n=1 Tax=Lentibacillus halophilus TaxID=295065 RepID=A0ABN0Z1B0_9BACI